jgi:peptide/nickel transport system permease protein
LPVFYITIETVADCDTLYRIADSDQRNTLFRIGRKIGNPEKTMLWFHTLLRNDTLLSQINTSEFPFNRPAFKNNLINIRSLAYQMSRTSSLEQRAERADSLNELLRIVPGLKAVADNWKKSEEILTEAIDKGTSWKQWIPAIRFHGLNNQYHRWLWGNGAERHGVLRGDFGVSFRDGQAVSQHIASKIKWTLLIMSSGLLLACFMAFFAGIFKTLYPTSLVSKTLDVTGFAFWAFPLFFLANLSLLLFANPDMLDWFPGSGVRDVSFFNPDWPFFRRAAHYLPHVILPVSVYALGTFGFLYRQFSSALQSEMRKEYITAGMARGLSKKHLIIHHALRNAIIPMITLLGQYFPLLISGSVILETIYSIPGMGLEIYESTISKDYPMIVALFTLFGFFTMLGYLLSDIGIALVDPRIRFSKTEQKDA